METNHKTEEIPLSQVIPDSGQPRKFFNPLSLERLAKSIEKNGLLQPILVRPYGDGKYIIVHGERRYRAHKLLGIQSIKCFIREIDEDTARDLQLIENLDRNDLTDMELAFEFQRRVSLGQSHQTIADKIGKSKGFVTQRLSLLKLPKEIQERVLHGDLSFSNARKLLEIEDDDVRSRISGQVSAETTAVEMDALVKAESVTRVTETKTLENDAISVDSLAVYQLLCSKTTVTKAEFLSAIGKDLNFLRGE